MFHLFNIIFKSLKSIKMKYLAAIIAYIVLTITSCAQTKTDLVGGPCEGCEAVDEFGSKNLTNTDTIRGFQTGTEKIKISGTVFKKDGKTPAENVVLYIYHTDETGRYPTTPTSSGWESRHGYLRTWLKTNADGYYEFYTIRPASYPNSSVPQHIHITVKDILYKRLKR